MLDGAHTLIKICVTPIDMVRSFLGDVYLVFREGVSSVSDKTVP